MPTDNNLLESIALFKGLPADVYQALLSSVRSVACRQGEVLGNVGEHLNYLIFVKSGVIQSALAHPDRKVVIATEHGPGSFIGWLSLIDHKPLASSLIAKKASEVLLIPMDFARKSLLGCESIIQYLLQQMAALIRKNEYERRMLSMPNAFQRIYFQILNLSQTDGSGQPEARLPKQDEIAAQVNTSRETVSRAVQNLVKQGIIIKQGHRIQLQRPELLRQLVEHTGNGDHGASPCALKKSA